MNIAVLICGEFREFEIAQKSWDFLKDLNSDFFVSTWDVSIQEHKYNNFYLKESVDENKIKKFLPNARISILNQDNFIPQCPDDRVWSVNLNKLIFHWKNCFNMVKSENKKYDIIILIRCDSYLNLSNPIKSFLSCNKNRTVYGTSYITIRGLVPSSQVKELDFVDKSETNLRYFTFDTFFMGNYEVMSNFIDLCPNNIDTNIHHILCQHVLDLGYYIDVIENFRVVVVRPTSRKHDLNKLDFYQIGLDHAEWNINYKL